ncbi:hypothetical protein WHZ77_13555 [Bradyrhizobium sp. A5]|uniref:hypothetical protein n=1 Tax=Bradyrhizobium sp. A5 TaxID=3133696 RepID=UPI003253D808
MRRIAHLFQPASGYHRRSSGRPCGWGGAEIKRAITQGIACDGHKLKPPMAYAAYATMTAQDLDDRRLSLDAVGALTES